VPMGSAGRQSLQNEQVEGALKKIQMAVLLLVDCRPIG
jgi:hypothetical protein